MPNERKSLSAARTAALSAAGISDDAFGPRHVHHPPAVANIVEIA